MRDNNILDKEESLKNKLELFKVDIDGVDEKPDTLDKIIMWSKNWFGSKLKIGNVKVKADGTFANHNYILTLLDSAIQLDGSFLKFCEHKNFSVETLYLDGIQVLPYNQNEYDPFVANGLFLIKTPDFNFIKSTLLFNAGANDNVALFTLIPSSNYEDYIKIKQEYMLWVKEREGVAVKVIGGEDYVQETDQFNWDNLFFGEKKSIKKEIKDTIDQFLQSKDFYKENNISWNISFLIQGSIGSGKSSLVNTLISEYEVEPFTVNFYNVDDSIITAAFKITEGRYKSLFFIDDFDDLIDQNMISFENLFSLLETYKANDGSIIVLTCKSFPSSFTETLFNFDKKIILEDPTYDVSINNLFGKFLTNTNLKDLQDMCKKNSFSYGYINKLYKLFVKKIAVKANNKKDAFNEIKTLIKDIQKENEKFNIKSKPKRIGLIDKK